MPTDAEISFLAATLPEGVCYASEQERLLAFASNLSGFLPGTFSTFIIGSATPAPEDQDKPWIADDGRMYLFELPGLGAWVSRHPEATGSIKLYGGTEASVTTFDGGEAGAVSAAAGPMWEIVTAAAARFILAPGTLPSGTVVAVGATGGNEEHTITVDEMPAHTHDVALRPTESGGTANLYADRARADNPEPTNLLETSEVGGGDKFSMMPPYYSLWVIRRTSRIWFRK